MLLEEAEDNDRVTFSIKMWKKTTNPRALFLSGYKTNFRECRCIFGNKANAIMQLKK